MLESVPAALWYSSCYCLFNIESSGPCYAYRVAIACNGMINLKCIDYISAEFKMLLWILKLDTSDLKRQFRRNNSQGIHDFGKPLWTYYSQRLRPVSIAHGQQQSRKTAYVIRMKMCNAQNINRFKAPAFLFYRHLRSLTAVYQKTAAVVPQHKRCEPPSRKWHHSARSEQTYIKHHYSFILIIS